MKLHLRKFGHYIVSPIKLQLKRTFEKLGHANEQCFACYLHVLNLNFDL